MTSERAPGGVRVTAALAAVVCCAIGGAILVSAGGGLVALLDGAAGSVFTRRDVLYVLVWCVFSAAMLAAGLSLAYGAFAARRHNLVPGPTLYVAGVSLVIIAFFLVAAGTPLFALVALALGTMLMVAEYLSETI